MLSFFVFIKIFIKMYSYKVSIEMFLCEYNHHNIFKNVVINFLKKGRYESVSKKCCSAYFYIFIYKSRNKNKIIFNLIKSYFYEIPEKNIKKMFERITSRSVNGQHFKLFFLLEKIDYVGLEYKTHP